MGLKPKEIVQNRDVTQANFVLVSGKKTGGSGKKPGGKSAPVNTVVDKPGKNSGNREKSGKGIILKCS